ncbi:MAG: glycosyltransferase family 9 protein [Verrucomicrobia bacterium]|jgi:ADP-heptose:LPS heptosyltransferase|nr:glycosyltransferase family 9 protein [Verrucomicrobiota bacterium]
MRECKSILLIKLDEIGDMILASPALKAIRVRYPSARITCVVRPEILPLVEHCPYVDQFLPMSRDFKTFGLAKLGLFARLLWFCARHRLFRQDCSWVLRTTPYAQECLLSLAAGARERVGWSNSELFWSRHCFTRIVDCEGAWHETVRLLAGVTERPPNADGVATEVWLAPEDRGCTARLAAGTRHIAIGCNAARLGRRSWPVERYGETINRIHARHPETQFIVVGGRDDIAAADELMRVTRAPVMSVAGVLSLRESCALLERCCCFLGNDSGPMHMAAAVGVPVIEVSCHPAGGSVEHANAPERFGPLGVEHRVCRPNEPASPCVAACEEEVAHCILSVSIDAVVDAFDALWCECMCRD